MSETTAGLDPVAIRSACDALLQLADAVATVGIQHRDSEKLQVLYGLCRQSINHARAALTLLDAGLDIQAAVNIRTALEHAVTAQWALLTPNGVGRVVNGAKHMAFQYFQSASVIVPLSNDGMTNIANWKSLAKLPSFAAICDELDGTHDPAAPKSGTLRFEYVRLSQATHVTSSTITGHLHLDPATGQAALRNHAIESFSLPNLWTLGMSLAMACWVIESLRCAPNYLADVERIADEAKLTSSLAADYEIAKAKAAQHKTNKSSPGFLV